MSGYRSFHCTARGHSHVLRNTVCQDASVSRDMEGIHIAVVSDGHGQKHSFRSDEGSRLAVALAAEKLRSFALELRNQQMEERLFSPAERERLLRQLARSIVGNWNIQVLQQLVEHPITDEEYALAGKWADVYRDGDALLQIYGATLIAAVVTDRYLLVLHQGDGRCVVIHENGRVDQPVPWDARCVRNISTSLCQEDAVESFRFYVADLRQDRIVACLLATDGIEDSFEDMKDTNAWLGSLAGRFAREGAGLEEQLAENLANLSRSGSQDDASVAAIVAPEAAQRMAERLELICRFRSQRREMELAQNKLRSMQRKWEVLKERYESAVRNAKRIRIRNRKMMLRGRPLRPGWAEELEKAEEELRRAREEYEAYREKRSVHVDSARKARENALQLRETLRKMEDGTCAEEDPEELQVLEQEILTVLQEADPEEEKQPEEP